MDIGKTGEPVKRWVAELRSLARRVLPADHMSVRDRMTMLLVMLVIAGLVGGLRIGES